MTAVIMIVIGLFFAYCAVIAGYFTWQMAKERNMASLALAIGGAFGVIMFAALSVAAFCHLAVIP